MAIPVKTPIARQSLVEATIDAIRELIENRIWKVGECIPREAELVEQFQVGRNTVREAIRVLSTPACWRFARVTVRMCVASWIRQKR